METITISEKLHNRLLTKVQFMQATIDAQKIELEIRRKKPRENINLETENLKLQKEIRTLTNALKQRPLYGKRSRNHESKVISTITQWNQWKIKP